MHTRIRHLSVSTMSSMSSETSPTHMGHERKASSLVLAAIALRVELSRADSSTWTQRDLSAPRTSPSGFVVGSVDVVWGAKRPRPPTGVSLGFSQRAEQEQEMTDHY